MVTYDVSGKVVLITGAARGIGNALARQLRARGALIAVVDLRPDDVDRAVEELGGDPVAIGFHADVTDRGAMQRVVAQTVERFGGVDVVVANAGRENDEPGEVGVEEQGRRALPAPGVALPGSAEPPHYSR